MSLLSSDTAEEISNMLATISKPTCLAILVAIGKGEACVCHLEAALNLRQAYISQHLMTLRSAGLLKTRREGRFIFYRLSSIRLLELIRQAAEIAGIAEDKLQFAGETEYLPSCTCPHCFKAIPAPLITIE